VATLTLAPSIRRSLTEIRCTRRSPTLPQVFFQQRQVATVLQAYQRRHLVLPWGLQHRPQCQIPPNLLLLTDLAVLTFLSVQTDCLATQHGASNCSCNVQAKPSLLYYRFGVCISFGVCSRFSLNLVFISLHILASALSGFHSFAWHIDCIPYQVFEVI